MFYSDANKTTHYNIISNEVRGPADGASDGEQLQKLQEENEVLQRKVIGE